VTPRPWLLPLGAAFGAAAAARARLYARGTLARASAAGPVISVGSLAVGGSGKTPLAARIATLLRESGVKVAVLSRGYGGHAAAPTIVSDGESVLAGADAAGDEPVALARALPGVVVAVARRRADAARLVESRVPGCVHVLDDGFQHLALRRDLDLVAVTRADLEDRPLPAGRLREGVSALRRADAVLLEAPPGEPLPGGLDPGRTLRWQRRSRGFASAAGAAVPAPRRAYLLAAIARPDRLASDVERLGVAVAGRAFHRDHHRFTAGEVSKAAAAAAAAGADAVVTTEKDLVRLAWPDSGPPLLVHRIEAAVEDEERLRALVLRAARVA
jgi:tetraacyldisaccharide 4'-kinase